MTGGSATVLGPAWALAPLAVILPWLVWRYRRDPPATVLIRVLLASYLGVLFSLTFFPLPLPPYQVPDGLPMEVNLQPFRIIRGALALGFDLSSQAVRLLIGNILAFIPLGVLLPLLSPAAGSIGRIFLIALLLSAGIELGQLTLSLLMGFSYRFTDVDDVILNVTGALAGYLSLRLAVGSQRVVERASRTS